MRSFECIQRLTYMHSGCIICFLHWKTSSLVGNEVAVNEEYNEVCGQHLIFRHLLHIVNSVIAFSLPDDKSL